MDVTYESQPQQTAQRSAEAFWRHAWVTPTQKASAIEWARVVFSWRDVCSIIAIVWLLWVIKSDLRDLNTNFTDYQKRQDEAIIGMQHQIDEWRALSKLAYEKSSESKEALSEIKGYLEGAGIKKVIK